MQTLQTSTYAAPLIISVHDRYHPALQTISFNISTTAHVPPHTFYLKDIEMGEAWQFYAWFKEVAYKWPALYKKGFTDGFAFSNGQLKLILCVFKSKGGTLTLYSNNNNNESVFICAVEVTPRGFLKMRKQLKPGLPPSPALPATEVTDESEHELNLFLSQQQPETVQFAAGRITKEVTPHYTDNTAQAIVFIVQHKKPNTYFNKSNRFWKPFIKKWHTNNKITTGRTPDAATFEAALKKHFHVFLLQHIEQRFNDFADISSRLATPGQPIDHYIELHETDIMYRQQCEALALLSVITCPRVTFTYNPFTLQLALTPVEELVQLFNNDFVQVVKYFKTALPVAFAHCMHTIPGMNIEKLPLEYTQQLPLSFKNNLNKQAK